MANFMLHAAASLILGEIVPATHSIGGWVRLSIDLKVLEKTLLPLPRILLRFLFYSASSVVALLAEILTNSRKYEFMILSFTT
jgi:hypothetical protein